MYDIYNKLKVICLILLGTIYTAKAPLHIAKAPLHIAKAPPLMQQESSEPLQEFINSHTEVAFKKITEKLFPLLRSFIIEGIEKKKVSLGITQCCMILHKNQRIAYGGGFTDSGIMEFKECVMEKYSYLQEQFATQMKYLGHPHEGWQVTRADEQNYILPALPASMEMVKRNIDTLHDTDVRRIVLEYIANQILLCCLNEINAGNKDLREAFSTGDTAKLKLYLEFQGLHDKTGPVGTSPESEQAEMKRFFNYHMKRIANNYVTMPLNSNNAILVHLQELIIYSFNPQAKYHQIPINSIPSISRKMVCQELQKVADQYHGFKKNLVFIHPENETIHKRLIYEMTEFAGVHLKKMRNKQPKIFSEYRSCMAKILLICMLFNNCYDVFDHELLPIFMSMHAFEKRRSKRRAAITAAGDRDECESIQASSELMPSLEPEGPPFLEPEGPTETSAPSSASASTQPPQQQQYVWIPVMMGMPQQYVWIPVMMGMPQQYVWIPVMMGIPPQ